MLLFRSKGSTPLFFPVNITWQIWSSRIVIANTDIVCPSQVLAFFRRRFWIVRGLSAVRKGLSNCMNCCKQNARPGEQIMDPFPSARVAPIHHIPMWAWTTLAPLFLRQGRLQVKRYGCLFTCRTMRTVHMEVAHILEADSFICAY